VKKGIFWVFEGVEGSGKTTQIKILFDYLSDKGFPALITKEPGSTDHPITQAIRKTLLDPEFSGRFSFRAEFLLFEADRAQHIDFVVRPAMEKGQIVLSDRHDAASFAYQHFARKICSQREFLLINNFATSMLEPDFTFWLNLDPAIGLDRNSAIRNKNDRIEKEALAFHQLVQKGYEKFFNHFVPQNKWQRFDASLPADEVSKQIIEKAEKLLAV